MRLTPTFWIANRVTLRAVDLTFRVATAAIISRNGRHRFVHAGIHPDRVARTLRRIRGLDDWPAAWAETAEQYLAPVPAAPARPAHAEAHAAAALCYHFAQVLEYEDLERKRRLSRRAADLFRGAAPLLRPPVRPVAIPWRDTTLPAYLRVPPGASGPRPVVVLLNGASTTKEEMIRWSGPFLARGLATLAIDTPGSGEAWASVPGRLDQDDIADAIHAFVRRAADLDVARVALLGVSLRGALAVRLAALTDYFAAAVSVTGPFHPAPYFRHLSRIIQREIALVTGASGDELRRLTEEMSLVDIAPRLRVPLLVIGAGRDLVVPPDESRLLYRAAAGPRRLLFLQDANHVGFSHMRVWTEAAAAWLADTLE